METNSTVTVTVGIAMWALWNAYGVCPSYYIPSLDLCMYAVYIYEIISFENAPHLTTTSTPRPTVLLVSPAMCQMTFLHLLLSRAWMIVNLNFEMQRWLLIPLGMYLSPDST